MDFGACYSLLKIKSLNYKYLLFVKVTFFYYITFNSRLLFNDLQQLMTAKSQIVFSYFTSAVKKAVFSESAAHELVFHSTSQELEG